MSGEYNLQKVIQASETSGLTVVFLRKKPTKGEIKKAHTIWPQAILLEITEKHISEILGGAKFILCATNDIAKTLGK